MCSASARQRAPCLRPLVLLPLPHSDARRVAGAIWVGLTRTAPCLPCRLRFPCPPCGEVQCRFQTIRDFTSLVSVPARCSPPRAHARRRQVVLRTNPSRWPGSGAVRGACERARAARQTLAPGDMCRMLTVRGWSSAGSQRRQHLRRHRLPFPRQRGRRRQRGASVFCLCASAGRAMLA